MIKTGRLINIDQGNGLIIEYQKIAGLMFSNHIHPHYELYFCIGDMPQHIVINRMEYDCAKPCIILCNPYMLHAMTSSDPGRRLECVCFYFRQDLFDSFDRRFVPKVLSEPVNALIFEIDFEQAQCLHGIVAPYFNNNAAGVQERELVFMLFLNKLCDICPDENIIRVGKSNYYIHGVIKYISENFMENLTSVGIAKHFAVSCSKLERDFRAATDGTVHSFIDSCRMNEAMMYLKKSHRIPITEIALKCGFSDGTYFYHFFKKYAGMSPLEYRNLKEAKPSAF